MEQDGVVLSRRHSGGGAVYQVCTPLYSSFLSSLYPLFCSLASLLIHQQDLGNTNFTILSPINENYKENNSKLIIGALARFGVTAQTSGRNDILVDGLKVGGRRRREGEEEEMLIYYSGFGFSL